MRYKSGGAALRAAYYTGLPRFRSCTAFVHGATRLGEGGGMGLLRVLTPLDAA